ncbi:MAG TPA: radical SAM family heme chaperone HemW [Deltaproteobacteria bacterium]|nr:radical SAM family heme chaperone HemW [Deltaproteobacteria bacterium]HPX19465.1 radical SAM family heme chaperone HemW [Deltaproteobacteria bacterium]
MTDGTENPGLYIHFPFCRKRCGYCDFYSITKTSLIPGFLGALAAEAELYRGEFPGFDTVYLGGGTPSLLTPGQVEILLDAIRASFPILPRAEITIEVNPADLSRDDMTRLRLAGVNRINIGVQSFDDRELKFLGRRHDRKQALSALEAAAAAGFDNIGLDLIYGLPGRTFDEWMSSLGLAIDLHPAHMSCYELELKPHTPLGRMCEQRGIGSRPEDLAREFFVRTSEIMEDSGYIHYEVSNFAAGMDRASRHNRKYWDHTPYLGLGPAAHSFRENKRWWNHESVHQYVRDLKRGKSPVSDSEALVAEQLALEALFLGLRTRQGIDLERFRLRYGIDLIKEKGRLLQEWSESGLIDIAEGNVRPTRSGMAVADALVVL